ncbi:hypothetical protein SAMN05518801_11740 [Novosphingobium sp. CF614]|uniref:hypothetical protein n=1 Tax=Novosphingobium sp. CF614 TaxID=1884364 RepID=UPI0008EDDFC7|nr:hypothetical protein [Novosphingobium sp. CF614]SFG33280.1 hypothetical protein SAMN05518801_11740 [Novosphingobium sp. CF614]
MQDEHFLRDWNAGHVRFSADLDDALRARARRLHRYGADWGVFQRRCGESPLARKARLTGRAFLGGLTAGTVLAVLLLVMAAVAGPETSHAASTACLTPPPLA